MMTCADDDRFLMNSRNISKSINTHTSLCLVSIWTYCSEIVVEHEHTSLCVLLWPRNEPLLWYKATVWLWVCLLWLIDFTVACTLLQRVCIQITRFFLVFYEPIPNVSIVCVRHRTTTMYDNWAFHFDIEYISFLLRT